MTLTDEQLDTIDFTRIHQHMQDNDWTWYFKGVNRVPSEKELRTALVEILQDNFSRSGGFDIQYRGTTVKVSFINRLYFDSTKAPLVTYTFQIKLHQL